MSETQRRTPRVHALQQDPDVDMVTDRAAWPEMLGKHCEKKYTAAEVEPGMMHAMLLNLVREGK